MKKSNRNQSKDLKEILPIEWEDLARNLKNNFLQPYNDKDKPTIFFSYGWVLLDNAALPSDEISDIEKFGEKIDGIKLEDCDIQAKLTRFKRYFEDIGFEVHMDLHSNHHGGPKLGEQLDKIIPQSKIRICFLTPIYKVKVERLYKNGLDDRWRKPCVLEHEYNRINQTDGPTFRFIMRGNRSNACPGNWEAFLCTRQEHKSELDQFKFICDKILIDPKSTLRNNKDFFNRQWAIFEDKMKPAISSTSDITSALGSQTNHKNNIPNEEDVKSTKSEPNGRLIAGVIGNQGHGELTAQFNNLSNFNPSSELQGFIDKQIKTAGPNDVCALIVGNKTEGDNSKATTTFNF